MWHSKENIMQTKINWFEIPSSDFSRAVRFYETIFDSKLKVEQFGGGPMGIFAGHDGSAGCVIQSEQLRPDENGTLIYLDATPGMDLILERIEAAGGRVLLKKTALPEEMGYIAHFLDTEGNRLALHAMH
jgi:uncharacterized protein